MRATVMGLGSWGTAFSMVLADAGNDVTVWGRDQTVVDAVNSLHRNPRFHPMLELPKSLTATNDAATALDGAELVVLALPAQSLRANLSDWQGAVPVGAPVVSLMKGLEVGTLARMSEVVSEVWQVPASHVAVISGPNLAGEIALRQPAATVVAGTDTDRHRSDSSRSPDRLLQAVHQSRRRRRRTRWRRQERHRVGYRHRRRNGLWRQQQGRDHHQRFGRDDATWA